MKQLPGFVEKFPSNNEGKITLSGIWENDFIVFIQRKNDEIFLTFPINKEIPFAEFKHAIISMVNEDIKNGIVEKYEF